MHNGTQELETRRFSIDDVGLSRGYGVKQHVRISTEDSNILNRILGFYLEIQKTYYKGYSKAQHRQHLCSGIATNLCSMDMCL